MKINLRAALACLFASALVAIAACGSLGANTSPAQSALNITAETCKSNDAAIVAASKAIDLGVLKGNDARKARDGLGAIQTGCVSALAGLQAAAAAAASAPR